MIWNSLVAALSKRKALALVVGVLLVGGSAALAPGLQFSSDVTEHMPKVSPQVTAWLDLSRRFDAFNSLIIGLEEPGEPMSAEGLAAVKRVTDALAAKKADGVLAVASVANVDSIHEGEDGSLETALLIPEVPKDAAALAELRARVAADLQVSGALISRDQQGYMVLVRADPRKDPAALAALVQRTVDENRGPLTPAYFGAAFFSEVITRGVYAKLTWLVPAFVALLFGVLAVLVRRWRAIFTVLGCAAASLVVWLGLVRVLGIVVSFTSLTGLLGVLALAVAAYARGLEDGSPNPLPAPVALSVLAAGLAALPLRWLPFAYVSTFGLGMAIGAAAVLLVGLFLFVPLSASLSPWGEGQGRGESVPRMPFVLGAVVLTLAMSAIATTAHFRATPESMFSASDDIGRSLAFFDRHFGGPDFIQVDFRGDLRDPNVAARLMRLTDLLEGTKAFPDVRSVTQVLGFLNKGFGGFHRVPTTRESLGNLWFFLEGRPDVRNLVSDARDEGMAVLRVPSKPERPVPELVQLVEQAVKDSLQLGAPAGKARLLALAKVFGVTVPEAKVDAAVAAATTPLSAADQDALDAEIRAKVHAWLSTPDSPYSPTDAEWAQLEPALSAPPAEREAKMLAVAGSFPEVAEHAQEFTETVLARVRDQRLAVRAEDLVAMLGDALPEPFRIRAVGVMADLLEPHAGAGDAATVRVTGLPVVTSQIQSDLMGGLWKALALLIGVGALALVVLTRKPVEALLATLAAATAAAVTLGTTGTFGFGVDSGSGALAAAGGARAALAHRARAGGGARRRVRGGARAQRPAPGAAPVTDRDPRRPGSISLVSTRGVR